MSDLNWEVHAFSPHKDPAAFVEKAPQLMDRPAQVAHRFNTVEASLADDESLLEFHRRVRGA